MTGLPVAGSRPGSLAEHYADLAERRGAPPLAVAALRERGFPGSKDEAWKYTRADRFLRERFAPSSAAPSAEVVEDGVFGKPEGFLALNSAFAESYGVEVPAGDKFTRRIEHESSGQHHLSTPRLRFVVREGATLLLIESYSGAGPSLTVAATELVLERDAKVHHLRLVTDPLHVGYVGAVLADGASLRTTSIIAGSEAARVELRVRTEGRATAELAGLALLTGEQHADHHVIVDHAAPHGTSRQQFRSLLDGRSRSVFTGRVIVRPDAQKTDAQQVHRALLLSEGAIVNARPQLEISADDVKCAHGAAVGSLDAESLFYLRQRGLDLQQARALLTTAFAGDVLETVPEGERAALEALVARFLVRS